MNNSQFHRRSVLQASLGWVAATATGAFTPVRGEVATGRGSLLTAQLRLGCNLVGDLAQTDAVKPNIVISPVSLATILALLDLGASDKMRAALHRSLGFDGLSGRTPAGELWHLRLSIARVLGKAAADSPLALANMLVFDPASKPFPPALSRLSASGASILVESLEDPKTVDLINRFVNDRTKGLISAMLSKCPGDTGLVAINALYFKDRWQMPFNPARTGAASFKKADGSSIDIPMMHSSRGPYFFRQNREFVAVDLSYATDDYKLVIVTTKYAPRQFQAFSPVLDWLGGQGFERASGNVAVPKFSSSGTADLLASFDSLGLKVALTEPSALGGLSAEALKIAGIVQKTVWHLNEEGTVAAAATGVVAELVGAQQDYMNLIVDKPFVFALRDQTTGLVLVTGYIGEPMAG